MKGYRENTSTTISRSSYASVLKSLKQFNGSLRMANKIQLPSNWLCDGKELKPKSGASYSNTWIFDGKEIKPKSGASYSNTWIWDGKELKPKSGASYSNTWLIDGNKAKPKSGAGSSNTFEIGSFSILVIAGQLCLRLW